MHAIRVTSAGGPEVLQWTEYPDVVPSPGEVLIDVQAAGVNWPDTMQRAGRYPAPPGAPADIPGLEVAGVIAAVGEGTPRWQVGDRVCALVAGGGYGEQVAVSGAQCLPVPAGLSFAEAASLPETYFTVWTNIFDRGGFQAGEIVLIHGGTSGIGVAGIQLVKAMGGTVYVTAGSDEKCDYAESLGAAKAINYRSRDFEAELKALVPEGVNLILDMVGGDYAKKNVNLLA
ncbi:MAG: NAD(P)H-quinone oxidoreductase, partial [Bacteroidota bacterium]